MSPLLDSGSHGLRTVRNPLISSPLQQRGKKLLVEPDSHNRAGPPPNWRPPGSWTRQLLKVVAGFNLVYPSLDLLVAHSTSVEKMLTHGSFVYETQSRSLPRNRNTRQPRPPSQTTTSRSASPRTLLNCYQRSTFADPHATIYWSANMQPQVRTIFKLATLNGPGFVESHTG